MNNTIWNKQAYGAILVTEGTSATPNTTQQPAARPMRTYKDRVFRMLFREKEAFLKLYNALNDTDYDDPEPLIVTTLENAIYLGMKNDVSFLLYDQLALYEHQSTWNPNLPLRDLFYVSSIYSNLTRDSKLHGTKLIRIPEPRFVVFYNGKEEKPERTVMRLSDAFEHPTSHPALELVTLILNINPGYNEDLKKKCRMLYEYTIFVSKVREYGSSLPFEQAVEAAINDCIAGNILREFLLKNRAEVMSVSIFEYNEELHIQQEREDAMEEGIQRGIQQGTWQKEIYLIKRHRDRGRSSDEISDILETELSFVNEIIGFIDAHPDADATELYTLWTAQKNKSTTLSKKN